METEPSPSPPERKLPGGTVTFLFTDIEGSTELLKQLGDSYSNLLTAHREVLRLAFEAHGGREVDTQGDAFFYSFARATEAVAAAVEAQRALGAHTWPGDVEVRVRMGLHTGEPLLEDEGYVGMDVHRAARVAHAGHGGQVLLSQTTTPLVQDQLPARVTLIDLGRHRLKDMKQPERISQLAIDGLRSEFPPLTSEAVLPPEFPVDLGPIGPPPFLEEEEGEPYAPPLFVGRERELEVLQERLDRALAGEGGIILLEGGAGRGKTAMMKAFARRAMETDSELLATYGSCSAFAGRGDPYLPFREALGMLAGEVAEKWLAGAISREHANRLWEGMPYFTQALVQHGKDLVGTFLSGGPLVARLGSAVGNGGSWLERLAKLAEADTTSRPGLDQGNLFEQYESVLSIVAVENPILFLIDDLQWADNATIDLLFHLGRRLSGRRMMLLCAYRPEEVAASRGPEPPPLGAVLSEFKRLHGDITLDISRTSEEEDRHFVSMYLDQEPNRLSPEFKDRLYKHTQGHPLFTVEVLRNMQERGDLIRDPEAGWIEAPVLDWNVLPSRVEGVIQERIERLDPDLRDMLRVASVEGSTFTAQVLIQVLDMGSPELSKRLHQDLARRHRLVQEEGTQEFDGQRLHRYRFRHELFQQHVYAGLGEFERAELHGQVGGILEGLYGQHSHNIAPQLARHFMQAGMWGKAILYLLISGDRARLIYANHEAIEFYNQALELMQQDDQRSQAVQTLLKLGLVHTAEFDSEAAEDAYAQAFALLEETPSEVNAPQVHLPEATLRIAVSEPVEWDPGKIGDDISTFIAAQLFQALVEVTPDHNVLPAAAARWEVGEGGRLYTFYLRRELKWSDGSPSTAHDFRYAWRRNLERQVESPLANLLSVTRASGSGAEGAAVNGRAIDIHCPDDRTLQVRLSRPCAYFPQLMALPEAFPAPEWNVEGHGEDWPDPGDLVCNGPYQIEDWSPGEGLLLSRNKHYTGRFPGNVGRVECTFIRDFDQALDAYAKGVFDAVSMNPANAKTVARAKARFPEELKFFPFPSTFFLTFLADRPPFEDARTRKAFIHAVDREQLIRQTSRGMYRSASGGFVPPGMPGHSPGIGLTFDPGLARRLLGGAKLGSEDQFPAVNLMTLQTGHDEPNVRFLLRAWREHLGVEVTHEDVSWREFLQRRDQDPPYMSLSGWSADYLDPDSMLRRVFHSEEGVNPPHWKDERFDDLVQKAARGLDQAERIQLYRAADRILVAERAAVMPIGYAQGRQLAKPWVKMPVIAPHMLRFRDVVMVRPESNG